MYQSNFDLPKGVTLPIPQGYRILLMTALVEEKTAGGIIRPDLQKTPEQTASMVGKVLAVGNLAYKDQDKFPTGPWCREGDLVMFKSYSGTRFELGDRLSNYSREFRLINDDTVEAVVTDITKLVRK